MHSRRLGVSTFVAVAALALALPGCGGGGKMPMPPGDGTPTTPPHAMGRISQSADTLLVSDILVSTILGDDRAQADCVETNCTWTARGLSDPVRAFVVLSLILLVGACAASRQTYQTQLEGWIGKTEAELVEQCSGLAETRRSVPSPGLGTTRLASPSWRITPRGAASAPSPRLACPPEPSAAAGARARSSLPVSQRYRLRRLAPEAAGAGAVCSRADRRAVPRCSPAVAAGPVPSFAVPLAPRARAGRRRLPHPSFRAVRAASGPSGVQPRELNT